MDKKEIEDLKKTMPLMCKVMENTIGASLASVKAADKPCEIKIPGIPEPTEEEKKASKLAWERFEAYIGDRHDEFDMARLDDEDVRILKEKGFIKEDGSLNERYEFYFSNDNILNMRTGRHSWMALAGRHFYYDLEKKEVNLYSMS